MDLRLKFNEDVVNYDMHRPTYCDDLFTDIIKYAKLDGFKKALEIGIGTGQATLPILKTGCNITAIELGEDLAEYSKNKFASFDNFNLINIDFESYLSPENEYDLIYSATAFHWLPEEIGFTKVFDMLKPSGTIALFWNHPFAANESDTHIEIQKAYDKYIPRKSALKYKPFGEDDCQKYIDLLTKYGFKNIRSKLYQKTRTLKTTDYISLLNTYSDHRAMEVSIKNALYVDITDAINRFGGEICIYDTMDLYLGTKP